ncbi:unnamed protein product [Thelazia callipaeda]|uniref:Ovule protein n=1 Tax=Thelazia callipaeda TaxID=103827 RepID=A0A0N5CXW5_THECL|nr:unnamed protein product [Thelazia callipaeda]
MDRDEPRSQSQSKTRMVVDQTKVRQIGEERLGEDNKSDGYMQVEISLAMEKVLDNSVHSTDNISERVRYEPKTPNDTEQVKSQVHEEHESDKRKYTDDYGKEFDAWIISDDGRRTRSHTNESYSSVLESDEKHSTTRLIDVK